MLRYTNFKFCPKCGSSNLIEKDEKSLECKSCNFQYFHNVAAAVGGIIIKNGKLLLVERAYEPQKGKFDIPGGFCDYNESLENSLKREIKEELNVKAKSLEYFCSFPNKYSFKGIIYHTTDSFFIVEIFDSKIEISDEISSYKWINVDEIDFSNIGFDSIKNAILKYKNHLENKKNL